jgi:hypothetical protein
MPLPGGLDSFVQVAPDSSGKKIAMLQTTDANQNVVYIQLAMLIGDVPDILNQINSKLADLLAVNRAILSIQQNCSNLRTDEDDFRLP